jgi:ornithine decarboxylase
MDLFRYRVYLKDEPKISDELVFINAGAYNFWSNFCDLEEIVTEIID